MASPNAELAFTVDRTPPAAPVFVATPKLTVDTRPEWKWKNGGDENISYVFALDRDPTPSDTATSSLSYRPSAALTTGSHRLTLAAVDAAGNWSPLVTYTITVDPTRATITAVAPAFGPLTGGTKVRLTGTKLDTITSVSMGRTLCSDIVVESPTSLVCKIGSGSGTVDVDAVDSQSRAAQGLTAGFAFLTNDETICDADAAMAPVRPEFNGTTSLTAVAVAGDRQLFGSTDQIIALDRFGALDQTFNGGRPVTLSGFPRAIRVLDSGLIVVLSGKYDEPATLSQFNADGTLDRTFGESGRKTMPFKINQYTDVKFDADGRFLVPTAEVVDSVYQPVVRRVSISGELDSSFGQGGMAVIPRPAVDLSYTVEVYPAPNGSIWVGLGLPNNPPRDFAMKLTADGALDTSFGATGYVQVIQTTLAWIADTRLLPLADGSVIAAYTDVPATSKIIRLKKFSPSGAHDTAFGNSGVLSLPPIASISNVVSLASGKIGVIGSTKSGTLTSIVTAAGALDSTYHSTGYVVRPPAGPYFPNTAWTADGTLILFGSGPYISTRRPQYPMGVRYYTSGLEPAQRCDVVANPAH